MSARDHRINAAEKVAREIADLIEGSEQYAVGGDVRALVPDIAARLAPLMDACGRIARNTVYSDHIELERGIDALRAAYAALLEPKT